MITVQYKDFDDMVATSKYIASLVGVNAAIAAALPVMPLVAAAQKEPEKPQKQEAAPFVPDKKEPVEQKAEEKAEAPAPAESGKTYTLEEVRAKLAELNKSGKRAEVKSLLGSFGAAKLSDIPADKYGELMEKAGEL